MLLCLPKVSPEKISAMWVTNWSFKSEDHLISSHWNIDVAFLLRNWWTDLWQKVYFALSSVSSAVLEWNYVSPKRGLEKAFCHLIWRTCWGGDLNLVLEIWEEVQIQSLNTKCYSSFRSSLTFVVPSLPEVQISKVAEFEKELLIQTRIGEWRNQQVKRRGMHAVLLPEEGWLRLQYSWNK